jgi:predicted MPP superfamily phosphohydrolase
MNISIPQLCSIMFYSAAGFCLFLVLLNRFLILMPDSRGKAPAIFLAFLSITGGSAVVGFLLHELPWTMIPAVPLSLMVVGEARRSLIRRSCAGSMPLDSTPHDIDLSKPFTTTDVIIHRYEVRHSHWTGSRLRIVHLTDLHVHPRLPVEYYQRVVDLAEQTQPDLVVFTGDFITNLDCLPKLREVLRPIAKVETFAVLGNHDYWTDPEAVAKVVTGSGLRLVTNESAIVTVDGQKVIITGYDYPWGTREKSISPQDGTSLHVVLSHTPDNIYRLAESSADIVFSGHYHAGQIRLPFLGSIVVPSIYGRRFDHGHFIVKGTHLFVSSGVGAASPAFRIYCKPDIFVVDILAGNETEGSPTTRWTSLSA